MNREEKIDAVIEFLDENNITFIDISDNAIGSIIIEADFTFDKEFYEDEYNEILEKGLTERDIKKFNRFLENNHLMMIMIDNIEGVSFENMEYDTRMLIDSGLFADEDDVL